MSVGRPYYDKMAVPVGVLLLFLMGIGPALPWGRASKSQLKRALLPPLIGAAIGVILGFAIGARNAWTLITFAFGGYTLYVSLREVFVPMRLRMKAKQESVGRAFVESQIKRGQRRLAAYIVHVGAVVVFVAIAVSSTMGVSRELQMKRGETATLGKYTLTFVGASEKQEPHRVATIAEILITDHGKYVATMSPRMNAYSTQREPVGTPDVKTRLTHDIYLSVMNIDAQQQAVGLHAMINPMIAWIWGATALMAFGGLVALFARPRPTLVSARQDENTPMAVAAGEAG
jgi:cytochrome c-type biogenesis protein CcmF